MFMRECETIRIDIYMAGDFAKAVEFCQKYCDLMGFCVHVERCDYIYTDGMEAGFKVGLINYPRFPEDFDFLWNRAQVIGLRLLKVLDQTSFSIVTPTKTVWFSNREEFQQPTCADGLE